MRRQLVGRWRWIARGVAIGYALFQIYTAGFGLLPDMQQRAIHVLLGLALTFLLLSSTKRAQPEKKVPIWDILLICLTIAACINTVIKYKWFHFHLGESSPLDLFLGVAIILLALEAARRVTGLAFPLVTLAMLLYTFLGPYIPGVFGHRGFSLEFVIQQLNQTTFGVWGYITGISATILAIFIIFGSFLLFSGGGQTFIDIALKLAGKYRGGPALVAVIASSMFGTISGSTSANVATTGNFTIPLMKRLGYKAEFAGGVEAAASNAGQITPPIMGAGAFIMAEFLGISYLQVAKAAIIPALLFFLAVFSGVRFQALKQNLSAIPAKELPKTRQLLTWGRLAPLFLPVAGLMGFLLQGYSPYTAAFWACVITLGLFLFSNLSLSQMKQRARIVISGLELAGIAIIQIVSLCVCCNIVVRLINLTGFGVKLSGLIIEVGGDFLPAALVLTAITALVLGMGMPTVAAYVIAASVVSTALAKLGLLPLSAHLFIFYFAVFASITPPVCTSAFIGSVIAGANWFRIATVALRLSVVAYLMPFIFVYDPAVLLIGTPIAIALATLRSALAAIFLAAGMMGYFTTNLNPAVRLLTICGGLLLMLPVWQGSLAGTAVVALALIGQRIARAAVLSRKRLP